MEANILGIKSLVDIPFPRIVCIDVISGSGGTAKRSQVPVRYAVDDLPLPSRFGNRY